METLLSFMPYLMQGLSMLTGIITSSNQSSAKNSHGNIIKLYAVPHARTKHVDGHHNEQ
nr:MAG TPA: hypothetical protein [Microviridae sp.]